MARKRKTKPKPIQRVTVQVNVENGVWETSCLCEPGCAVYRCCLCGHEWRSRPAKGMCPECQHEYFEWVNYAAWCRTHA